MAIRHSLTSINAKADAIAFLLRGGSLRVYAGKAPDSPDGIADEVLLAEHKLGDPAFGKADNGTIKSNAIEDEFAVKATAKATWFRAVTKTGTPVFDGTVGVVDGDLRYDDVQFVKDAKVRVESFIYTVTRKGLDI